MIIYNYFKQTLYDTRHTLILLTFEVTLPVCFVINICLTIILCLLLLGFSCLKSMIKQGVSKYLGTEPVCGPFINRLCLEKTDILVFSSMTLTFICP